MNKVILDSFKYNNYYDRIKLVLNYSSVTHQQRVAFALACAKDLEQYYDVNKNKDVYNTRKHCLDLVGKWLLDPKSVSKKELDDAANAATHAAYAAYAAANAAASAATHAAAYAAYAAASAANAANAAASAATHAAYAATHAAYAAYAAANAAYAAYAAAYAANAAKSKELFYKLLKIIDCNNIFKLLN